ncbi:MAG: nascent polypeptide-associated complex protein [Candidatus Marsarchaeota archaeon]|jgi:nascent polypeptide-associated complex subunit alpha|nr:nascent polypeptide-associated complex protein [Candidatus Marsarchaeota archaeon]MCL5111335.1 nascent polypeptide-associated complex protein [Candidatus Marsarchaeota archaeon]
MMPNIDPRALKEMMAKMGIKTSEIDAQSVTIHCADKDLVITNPQVTRIEAQGSVSFQVVGNVQEKMPLAVTEITDDDIKFVMEKTGVSDKERVRTALRASNGDLAAAILALTEK